MPDLAGNMMSNEDIFRILQGSRQSLNQTKLIPNISNGFAKTNNTVYTVPLPIKIYLWTITVTSVIGIIGNVLVLLVYLRNCREMTPFKFLISHLAFCDLLFSIAQIFELDSNGWYAHGTFTWMLDLNLCKFTRSSVHLGSLVSVGTILVITIERFQGLTQGILINLQCNKWKKVFVGTGFIWIIAVCSDIPIFMSVELINNTCRESFGTDWDKALSIYLLLVSCLFPMVAMLWMNGKIIFELKKPCRTTTLYKSMLKNTAQLKKRKDMRVVKILVTVIIAFFICVLPIRIMWVVQSFFDFERTDTWSVFYKGYLSYPLHVAVNPVIYSIIDKNFRKNLIGILLCRKWKSATSNNAHFTSSNNNSFSVSLGLRLRSKIMKIKSNDTLVPNNTWV